MLDSKSTIVYMIYNNALFITVRNIPNNVVNLITLRNFQNKYKSLQLLLLSFMLPIFVCFTLQV